MIGSMQDIMKNCNIYIEDSLVSEELIIKKYLDFFSDAVALNNSRVNFAMHTGSVCFDAVSLTSIVIGCFLYAVSTNDEIIESLRPGDMVMYQGQRYRWNGITKKLQKTCVELEQDGKGKNGTTTIWIPYEKCKHLILPYYGESKVTDGRGVKRKDNKRENILSKLLDVSPAEIPSQLDVSVVVVAERERFADICKTVTLQFKDGRDKIALLDIVPASYYTAGESEYQFGSNPSKVESVLKVTGSITKARELILNKNGNKTVGVLVFGSTISVNEQPELLDILRRKSLKFAIVETTMQSPIGNNLLDTYEDAAVFACTKSFLAATERTIVKDNKYTDELYKQSEKIVANRLIPVLLNGGMSVSAFSRLKRNLLEIKCSMAESKEKEDFIITAYGLMNLFTSALFSMKEMEDCIQTGILKHPVRSPKERIDYLWETVDRLESLAEIGLEVIGCLEEAYQSLYEESPKALWLKGYVSSHCDEKTVVVVPKAYYIDIWNSIMTNTVGIGNVKLVTASKRKLNETYDNVIIAGDYSTKKFDAFDYIVSNNTWVILYGCEERNFQYKRRAKQKTDDRLNNRIGVKKCITEQDSQDYEISESDEKEMSVYSSLDEYIEEHNMFDIRKIASYNGSSGNLFNETEVARIGTFESGKHILFSKFYSAVVYDTEKGTVSETKPEKLIPGDVLVFTKRDKFTRNIVDNIYDRLLTKGKLPNESVEMYEKSQYWKEVLREYQSKYGLKYSDLVRELKKYGVSVNYATIREWLTEDSHVIGPQKVEIIEAIAKMTRDPYLLESPKDYFEACRYVRSERRTILKLIGEAINDKLRGLEPKEGSDLEIVFRNVEKITRTERLEEISEIEEKVYVNSFLVNRPISETEVIL